MNNRVTYENDKNGSESWKWSRLNFFWIQFESVLPEQYFWTDSKFSVWTGSNLTYVNLNRLKFKLNLVFFFFFWLVSCLDIKNILLFISRCVFKETLSSCRCSLLLNDTAHINDDNTRSTFGFIKVFFFQCRIGNNKFLRLPEIYVWITFHDHFHPWVYKYIWTTPLNYR